MKNRLVIVFVLFALLAAACGGTATPTSVATGKVPHRRGNAQRHNGYGL